LSSSLEHLQNGRYAVLKKLGEGGKGIVYKVRDTVLNRVVAIKMLKNPVSEGEAYSRFITEAQSVAKLNHPNIVSIHDIGKEDGKQFFVLEFVEGHDLRDLMQASPEGRCDIQTVLRVGVDVCNALQYAHSQGILHRDIKPENIKVTAEGVAKLMDFGLAKMLGQPRQTQEGVIVGTVAYVAPEIALGKGADARSDLYSLGAVLYEALTGRPPFAGDDPVKIIFSHVHDHPVSPDKLNPKVPQPLAECVTKLLEKDPERRYQTATDLLGALRDLAGESPREVRVPLPKPSVAASGPQSYGVREVKLIDRVEEMALLREAVDRAVRGEGGLVFLYGEPGIGKTRLAREIGAYGRLRGMQVLSGRCPALFRMDGVPPYILWNEVIKDYLEMCTPQQLYRAIGLYPSEVCKLVPQIKEKLGTVPMSPPLSPEDERDRLFEAVSQFVTNISKESPLLVVLDDLQWTDQSSLLLLHYLARGVQKEPMLLLGTYRHTDIDEKHALSPVLTELNRERLLQPIRLRRMSQSDTLEMIKQILEQDDVPREFCELLYEKTGGNPFFIEETIKSLQEEEIIFREENKWMIKDTSRIEFPETVKRVIEARIGRLDEPSQHILTMASFLGKDFTFEALQGVMGFEEEKLLESMERILKTGLIKERIVRGEESYSFADVVVREVVHEEVSLLRHKKLHGVVGYALEKVYVDRIDEHLGELAYHFLEGGYKDKALEFFLRAAEKAVKVYAHGEASAYFQSALSVLEEMEGEPQKKGYVLEKLGDAKEALGEHDASTKHWNEALLLWKKLDENEKVSRIDRKIAKVLFYVMDDKEKAEEHCREASKISEAMLESVELASLYSDSAWMQWYVGDYDAARLSAEKAIKLAERLNAQDILADSYRKLGVIVRPSDAKKAIEFEEKALKIALDNNCLEVAVRAYNNLALSLPSRKKREPLEKGYELARKVGDIWYQVRIGGNLGLRMIGAGNIDKGLPFVEELLSLARKAGHLSNIAGGLTFSGYAYLILGEWEKSEKCLEESWIIAQRSKDFQQMSISMNALGWLCLGRGEYVKAAEWFEKLSAHLEKAGAEKDLLVLQISSWLIMAYIELEEIEKAENQIDILRKSALETADEELTANTNTLKAMVLRAQKKWEESIELFEKSLQEWEALDVLKWNAYIFARMVLFEYARVYLERDQEGDREKAHSLLNQALEIFEKIGAKKDIEKVIAKRKLLTA